MSPSRRAALPWLVAGVAVVALVANLAHTRQDPAVPTCVSMAAQWQVGQGLDEMLDTGAALIGSNNRDLRMAAVTFGRLADLETLTVTDLRALHRAGLRAAAGCEAVGVPLPAQMVTISSTRSPST